jgi:hypothetical protein
MSFSNDFFRSSQNFSLNYEDSLMFLIENFNKIMEIHRVIEAYTEKTNKEIYTANKELKKLRKIDDTNLTKIEKKELQAKKEVLEKIRDQETIMYYNGEELNSNNLYVQTIKKYHFIITKLEKLDRTARTEVSNILKETIDKPIKAKGKESKFYKMISKISFSNILKKSLNIDINSHQPKKKKEKESTTTINI